MNPSKATSSIERILDVARWAPSGDNTQPWRFEILGPLLAVVHGADTRHHCVYDLDGHPSQIAIGALLETAAIAASDQGLSMSTTRRPDVPDTTPTFDLHFHRSGLGRDPLFDAIEQRSVQRRAMGTRRLTSAEKQALESAAGPEHRLLWLEGVPARLRTALLMFNSAKLRLTLPEAYRTHRDVIEWDARFSQDRVPDQALGIDALTIRLMRFVMHSWARVAFFNRFFAGSLMPRIQMDLIPGLACGAHFVLLSKRPPASVDDYVAAGRAVQRFWLTATRLGLGMQPEVTPLIFSRYAREKRAFSAQAGMTRRAQQVCDALTRLVGAEANSLAVYMGRLGTGKAPSSRSLRKPLSTLMAPTVVRPKAGAPTHAAD